MVRVTVTSVVRVRLNLRHRGAPGSLKPGGRLWKRARRPWLWVSEQRKIGGDLHEVRIRKEPQMAARSGSLETRSARRCAICGTFDAVTGDLCRSCRDDPATRAERVEHATELFHDPLAQYREPFDIDDVFGDEAVAKIDHSAHGVEAGVPAFDSHVLHGDPAPQREAGEPRQKTVETRQRMRQAPRHQKHMPRTKKAAR